MADRNPEKVDALRKGEVPIYEPGLDDLMAKNVTAGRLPFFERLAKRMVDPTPADLRNIYSAKDAIRAGFVNLISVGHEDYTADG